MNVISKHILKLTFLCNNLLMPTVIYLIKVVFSHSLMLLLCL